MSAKLSSFTKKMMKIYLGKMHDFLFPFCSSYQQGYQSEDSIDLSKIPSPSVPHKLIENRYIDYQMTTVIQMYIVQC